MMRGNEKEQLQRLTFDLLPPTETDVYDLNARSADFWGPRKAKLAETKSDTV